MLLVATLAFGLVYADIERRALLEVERGHLEHIARLVALRLSGVETREALEEAVRAMEQELNKVCDTGHEIVVRDERGTVLRKQGPAARVRLAASSWI